MEKENIQFLEKLKEEKFKMLFDAIEYQGYRLDTRFDNIDKRIIKFFLDDSILNMDFENMVLLGGDCDEEDLLYAICDVIFDYFDALKNDGKTKNFILDFLGNHNTLTNDYQNKTDKDFNLDNNIIDIVDFIKFLSYHNEAMYEFLSLYLSKYENYNEDKSELRTVILRDDEGQGDLYVETNASKEIIQEALMYRDELRERNQIDTYDFDIIQEYINKKGYIFKDVDKDKEVYIW